MMGGMEQPIQWLGSLRDRYAQRQAEKHAHLSPQQRLWRRRFSRWARTAIAFAITMVVAGGAYVLFVATQGGVNVDLNAPGAEAPRGGSPSVAEAATLLTLRADDFDSGALFLPDRHRRRVALFQEGASETVASFVEVVARRRARDKDLDAAAALLIAPQAELPAARVTRGEQARAALVRFNARVGERGPPMERSAKTLAAMARAAAATCAAQEQAVREAAVRGRFGPADPGAEAAFFRARGAAYAWARLLALYGGELPAKVGAPLAPALEEALHPLRVAAEFEPRVLFSASPGGVAPNHLERLATDLAAAVAAARRLDNAAEPG
jgi:hypothetical protein